MPDIPPTALGSAEVIDLTGLDTPGEVPRPQGEEPTPPVIDLTGGVCGGSRCATKSIAGRNPSLSVAHG